MGKHRLLSHLLCLQSQSRIAISAERPRHHRTGIDLVTPLFGHSQGLASHHALVHEGSALTDNRSVYGNTFSCPHLDGVSRL